MKRIYVRMEKCTNILAPVSVLVVGRQVNRLVLVMPKESKVLLMPKESIVQVYRACLSCLSIVLVYRACHAQTVWLRLCAPFLVSAAMECALVAHTCRAASLISFAMCHWVHASHMDMACEMHARDMTWHMPYGMTSARHSRHTTACHMP